MPQPRQHPELRLPIVRIDAAAASAPEKVALALDCALGRVSQVAGAFAA
jgi:HPr kinase/phosphorylase